MNIVKAEENYCGSGNMQTFNSLQRGFTEGKLHGLKGGSWQFVCNSFTKKLVYVPGYQMTLGCVLLMGGLGWVGEKTESPESLQKTDGCEQSPHFW